ncbi:MAG: PHP domain-containing protein [Streptosporangiales bacterium]|nr:PHP domain-containing protein [Streptosporangiales bacterium]
MRIDLHAHSTASDGTDTPEELVRNAADAGLTVVALTDHDTVGGHARATAALPDGLTLVPGAEISCRYDGRSVHLLAYLFDPDEPAFAAERDRIRSDRVRRAREMVVRLRELGVPVTWERVEELADGGSVGRPHVARAMIELGVVTDVPEAFTEQWIGHGGRAHVSKYALDPVRAVELVRGAGGVAVLAHAKAASRGASHADALIETLAGAGLAGVEVDHPDHTDDARTHLRSLARELDLVGTGSSDYHGESKHNRLGQDTTRPDAYEALVAGATGAAPVRSGRSRVR